MNQKFINIFFAAILIILTLATFDKGPEDDDRAIWEYLLREEIETTFNDFEKRWYAIASNNCKRGSAHSVGTTISKDEITGSRWTSYLFKNGVPADCKRELAELNRYAIMGPRVSAGSAKVYLPIRVWFEVKKSVDEIHGERIEVHVLGSVDVEKIKNGRNISSIK